MSVRPERMRVRQAEGIPDSGDSVQSPRSKRGAVCSRTVRPSVQLEHGGGKEETKARGDRESSGLVL